MIGQRHGIAYGMAAMAMAMALCYGAANGPSAVLYGTYIHAATYIYVRVVLPVGGRRPAPSAAEAAQWLEIYIYVP